MNVSFVFLNYKDAETCKKACLAIAAFRSIDHIVVVDNCSPDDSFEQLCTIQNEKIIVIQTVANKGYSYGFNFGIQYVRDHFASEYVFICNTDVIVGENTLMKCIQTLEQNSQLGAVSTNEMDLQGRPLRCAWSAPTWKDEVLYCFYIYRRFILPKKRKNERKFCGEVEIVDSVAGNFTCYRLDAFLLAGMYDDSFFLYNEENIIGQRLRKAGYQVSLLPKELYIHNHKGKRTSFPSFSIARAKEIKEKNSGYNYQVKYNHIGKLKAAILWLSICIAMLEASIIKLLKGE